MPLRLSRYGLLSLIALLLTTGIAQAEQRIPGNTRFNSFNKVKKALQKQVYYDHPVTFYCGSMFDDRKNIFYGNGYVPKKKWKRAHRIEWEHLSTASSWGRSFSEWRNGDPKCVDRKGKPFKGRNCARKTSTAFRYMEADAHNLVPAIGEINGLRSNYSFAMIPGEAREFGTCDMEIQNRKAEPPPQTRGNIARTYWYMDAAYPGHGIVSKKNQKLFAAWAQQDPVDEWECERQRRIKNLQGNSNPFVEQACQAAGI